MSTSSAASPIHPTACVADGAQLGSDVSVGPFAVIERGAKIAADCNIGAHAVIHGSAELEERVHVSPHAVIGGLPQDKNFDPATPSGVHVGSGTVIREGVTIHRSTRENMQTEIGPGVYLMANSHVAHDCVIGEKAVLANGVLLAGFVEVGAYAFLGGNAVFQQFIRVGESAIISGCSRIARSVPPFTTTGERNTVFGLNLVGIKRRGFDDTQAVIGELKRAYKMVLLTPGNPKALAAAMLQAEQVQTPQADLFLRFITETKDGLCRTRHHATEPQ